jgi:photosystem II stability/assembly factor-like uncharacterized protein
MATPSWFRRFCVVTFSVLLLSAGSWTLLRAATPVQANALSGLVWRNIGPFRGGRVAAVSGAVGQSGTFYMGLPLGGVWKTTSAGRTWYPVFDDVKEASSVGSVEVAPSDPNVIYVGMGDLITGGGINEGNGMYKSSDAGKTWKHLGLDDTKQIPAILVDPKNPNLVLIAAQGNVHTLTDQRGIFRSTDGGTTWTKTLYVDNQTGGQDLAWAYDKPDVVLGVTVRHYTAPGGAGRSGGGAQGGGRGAAPAGPNGTGLYKSTDQGVTWTEIKGHGLPDPMTGRMSVAVAMNTNAQRMFVIGTFGLYRSDDGGDNWKQMAANDRRIANGQGNYTSGVFVDSKNPDIVYTLATCSYKSTDGGATFTAFKGAPGGDDPQVMWIDPTDGQRIFFGYDQGAIVSLDGGTTWSSWYNQATEQFYHVATDNQWPYWVYGPMQDSGAAATRNRGDLGEITPLDWMPHPGYEFGSVVPDPLNPKITYAGGPASGIIKATLPSQQWINVSPNFDQTAGLRKVGNQLLRFSPTNPKELLAGFNFLMATTDGGMHWKKLSPDLGYPTGVKPPVPNAPPPAGTPPPPAGGSIDSFSISAIAPGTIWAGTNNGLLWLTKDHGVTWKEVTIPNLPNPTRMDVSTVEASHYDAATAYVAVEAHGAADYAPYLYRTRDSGKTWTKIVNGLATDQPSGSFARFIREDPKKAGLLFAGTESSMYVSFNDGDEWQSLQLNLPNTSCRDMEIHGNDLVLATYGRSFWILDDFSPLRQITPAVTGAPAYLFKPADAIRVRRNVNGDTPMPPEEPHAPNPPVGAIIYYYLGATPAGVITLDVSDAAGRVVRHLSSAPIPPLNEPPPAVPDYWLEKPQPMPTAPGTNRIHWDIRYDNPPAFTHTYEINATVGETPVSPEGPLAAPGIYTLKLTVDGKAYTQTVSVKNDPRSPASSAELSAQARMQTMLYDRVQTAWNGYQQVAAMRATVAALPKAPPIADDVTKFDAKLAAIGGPAGNAGRGGGGGQGGAPAPPSFRAAHASQLRQLNSLDTGDMAPNETATTVFNSSCADLKKVVAAWSALNARDLADFNAVLRKNNLPPVAAASPALTAPVCAAPAVAAKK